MEQWTPSDRRQFGQRLAEAREAAKLTQTQVAAIFDIGKAAVSAWEQGRNLPTVDRLAIMAHEFGVSAEWLLTGVKTAWPFGSDVALDQVAALPAELKQQAIGALRVLIAQAASRKQITRAA